MMELSCRTSGGDAIEGLNGFDIAHQSDRKRAGANEDHRKRRCNQLSADSNQRDFALAA